MRTLLKLILCGALACAGCGGPAPSKPAEATAAPAAPAIPADVQTVANTLLGAEAEVLVYGDLAKNGQQQVLAINRMPKTPNGVVPGILLTRAVVAENDGGKWKELFRCDEHLKNTNGYLGGTPAAPVTGWRLQYEQDAEKGLLMFFIPLQAVGATHPPTISVRWNPKVKRYQSLDRNLENFLTEVPSIETVPSYLK